MSFTKPLLSALDALDVERVPDHLIFTVFLDWARSRGLIEGYYLILFHQTGPAQGKPTYVERLKRNTPPSIRDMINKYVDEYISDGRSPYVTNIHIEDHSINLYVTPASRIYDIDLGLLIFISKHRVKDYEIDTFIRFMESNISIRKQSIAAKLTPPFVDLALQEAILLDYEVGTTVVKAIEANQTHVLSFDGEFYKTAYSTQKIRWSISPDDPIVVETRKSSKPFYVQDINTMVWSEAAFGDHVKSALGNHISRSDHGSGLVFGVKHNTDLFAIIICLFKRSHAVSMTEYAIASHLQHVLADYYRLGYERHKVGAAAEEATDVERKAREALLIADIMHDATDDLLAARNSIDSWQPRSEIEKSEYNNAKRNLKHLQSTAKLFRFLFSGSSRQIPSAESVLSSGRDYYSEVDILHMCQSIKEKYSMALTQNKIAFNVQVPPSFTARCMEVSVARALDNCVKNSIRHLGEKTHTKRKIKITAKNVLHGGDAMIELTVWDNGPGIDPAWLPRVHKPFVSNSPGGMGLGLSIAGTVCEIHHGSMKVTSEWGSWTNVSLRIPQL